MQFLLPVVLQSASQTQASLFCATSSLTLCPKPAIVSAAYCLMHSATLCYGFKQCKHSSVLKCTDVESMSIARLYMKCSPTTGVSLSCRLLTATVVNDNICMCKRHQCAVQTSSQNPAFGSIYSVESISSIAHFDKYLTTTAFTGAEETRVSRYCLLCTALLYSVVDLWTHAGI